MDELELAKKLNSTKDKIVKAFSYLDQLSLVQYEKCTDETTIRYLVPRRATIDLELDVNRINQRIQIYREKIHAMLDYASNKSACRSNMLLAYFGEKRDDRCGICDFCVGRNKLSISELTYQTLSELVEKEFGEDELTLEYILTAVEHSNKEQLKLFLAWLAEYDMIGKQENGKFRWNKSN